MERSVSATFASPCRSLSPPPNSLILAVPPANPASPISRRLPFPGQSEVHAPVCSSDAFRSSRCSNFRNLSALRLHSENDPLHSFVVTKKRQVQHRKASLATKPGQLSFSVSACCLL